MCYNCGCGKLDDDMGNPKNITNKTFEEAANPKKAVRKEEVKFYSPAFHYSLPKESTDWLLNSRVLISFLNRNLLKEAYFGKMNETSSR